MNITVTQIQPIIGKRVRDKYNSPNQFSVPIALVILAGISIGVFSIANEIPVVMIFFCLCGGFGLALTLKAGSNEFRVFATVYSVSVLAAIILYYVYQNRYGVPYYIGGSDDLNYEQLAKQVAHSLDVFDYESLRSVIGRSDFNSTAYVYIVSLIYHVSEPLGGFHTMLPRVVNCFILGLLASMTYRLARNVNLHEKTSLGVGMLIGLMPISVFTAIHTFRDVITSFVCVGVITLWQQSDANSRLGNVLKVMISAIALVVLSDLRLVQALAIGAVVFIVLAVPRQSSVSGNKIIARLFLGTGVFMLGGYLLYNLLTPVLSQTISLADYYTQYKMDAAAGLSYYVFAAPVPWTYVLRILYAFVSEIPFYGADPEAIWRSAGGICIILVLPFLISGFVVSVREVRKWPVLLAFVSLFGMVLVSFTFRHIIQYLPYACVIAGVGYERLYKHRATIIFITLFACLFAVLSYFGLRK